MSALVNMLLLIWFPLPWCVFCACCNEPPHLHLFVLAFQLQQFVATSSLQSDSPISHGWKKQKLMSRLHKLPHLIGNGISYPKNVSCKYIAKEMIPMYCFYFSFHDMAHCWRSWIPNKDQLCAEKIFITPDRMDLQIIPLLSHPVIKHHFIVRGGKEQKSLWFAASLSCFLQGWVSCVVRGALQSSNVVQSCYLHILVGHLFNCTSLSLLFWPLLMHARTASVQICFAYSH